MVDYNTNAPDKGELQDARKPTGGSRDTRDNISGLAPISNKVSHKSPSNHSKLTCVTTILGSFKQQRQGPYLEHWSE